MAGKRVTAFVLDPEHVQASEDGMTVPPLPGLWTNDKPVHPEALGLTLTEMRDLVEALSLPLVETTVPEGRAASSFATPDYLLPTAPSTLGGIGAPIEAEIGGAGIGDGEIGAEDVDVERARVAADETDDSGEAH